MAKAIKTAIIATVIVVGGAFLASFIPGATAVAYGTLAATTFATTLVASVIGKMTSKGINASAGNFGSKFATRAPLAPRQIVYGQCRVGGTLAHIETTGTDNYLLHMVVAIAGHEIESLESIRLNDINTTTSTSTISGSTVYTVTNSDFRNTENENKFDSNGALVRYTFSDGSQTAVDGYMNAQLSSMGTTDKFLGVAYVYIQMVFDAEQFGGGQPAVSFKVKGKNVFDPRTNAVASSDLQRSNPALIIRDYLTDTQYGLKAKTSEINDTTNAGGIASAANTCDQNVTLADGSTTERRYTTNGFTNFSANGNGVLESVLSSMAGKMSYVNGQFTVFAGASQSPSLTITDDDLLAPIAVSTNASTGDLYNSIKPVYVDASLNFISADAEVYADSTMLNADTPSGESTANYVKRMEVQLPFTVTDTMAQRLGRIALKSQRQTTSLQVSVSLQFMRLQPNDWVYLTNERLNFSQKVFEVISTNMEVIQDGDVPVIATRLELKEVEAAVFNFATNDYTTGQSEGSNVSTGTYAVTAPTNLALTQQSNIDGTTSKVDIKVAWTNNASDKVTLTEIEYKLSTDSDFTSDFTVGKRVAVGLIPNVVVGKTYNVRIRHIDVNGVTSPYTSNVNISIAVAGTTPAVPTNLTVSSGKLNILVSWTNPNNSDLRAVKVYRRTANTNPTDDTHLVETIGGEPNKISTTIFGDQDGITAGTTYYFWVRSVNHSGQESALSSSENGNFTSAAIGDGTITTLKLAANAVTQAKIAVNAIQGSVIAAGAITASKIGTDAVETAKIADNAVTNALIATDAVNQDSIAANAVTATQIVSGTITASEIASNAITTAKIAAGQINADKIASNAITAVKITAGAIVAGKLAADSIVATNIQTDAVTTAKTQADAGNADKINVSTLSAITANVGTLTAGTINGTNMSITNLSASNISAGSLNAQRLTINGSTLTADGNGLKISTSGITTTEIGTRAVGAQKSSSSSGTSNFPDGRSGDNFGTIETFSFTTSDAGLYMIQASCMVGGDFHSTTQLESRIRSGGTVIADYLSPIGSAAIQPIIQAGTVSLNAAQTVTIDFQGQVKQDNPAGGEPVDIGGFSSALTIIKLSNQ